MIEPFDTAELGDAVFKARRRMPGGMRMTGFRWAETEAAVWMFPAALTVHDGLAPLAARGEVEIARKPGAAFWLCTAVRQDLYRAVRQVKGLLPVVRVAPVAGGASTVHAGCLLPPHLVSTAVATALEGLFVPQKIENWVRFARIRQEQTSGEFA